MPEDPDANKALLRRMFREVLEADSFDEQLILRYFSPSYVQHVDGKTLHFSEFIDHVRELKRTVTKLRFTFDEMIAEGGKVMEIHRVEGEKRTGGKFAIRLFSFWKIEDGKIVSCDEVSCVEQGSPEDRDLGSRRSRR